ncbi:MAG: DUF58 domain-containing protein [Desulfobacterales bacterium]|jgi:uncharacterized protein (DUF58 family)
MPLDHQENREPTIFNSLLILLFVGIFLFVALLYRQNDLSLLAILILTVVGAAKAWSAMSGDRIRSDSTIDSRRVFPGETVTLATTVENGKWLPVWLRIMWSFEGALYPVGGQGNITRQQAAVMWHQTVEFRQNFVASRRGVYQVGPPRIRTSDFLGFFKKELNARSMAWLIVYPQLVSLRPVAIRRRDLFGVPGARNPIKDPVYILGTREYQPSRPSRHIHWKASARHLRLQEKIFEPSEQEKVLLTLEVGSFERDSQRNGFERTLEVVASLAVRLDNLGYAVGLVANGTLKGDNSAEIPPSRGPRQVPAILEALARIQATPDKALTKVIQKFLGSQRGISCVHFCCEEDSSLTEMEKFFHRHQIPVSFLVYHLGRNTRSFKGSNRYSIAEICLDRSRKL